MKSFLCVKPPEEEKTGGLFPGGGRYREGNGMRLVKFEFDNYEIIFDFKRRCYGVVGKAAERDGTVKPFRLISCRFYRQLIMSV